MTDKTAVVTGGSKGIGFAIAESLVRDGISVMITARKQEPLMEAAEKLRSLGTAQVEYYVGNVGNPDDATMCVELAIEKFGTGPAVSSLPLHRSLPLHTRPDYGLTSKRMQSVPRWQMPSSAEISTS